MNSNDYICDFLFSFLATRNLIKKLKKDFKGSFRFLDSGYSHNQEKNEDDIKLYKYIHFLYFPNECNGVIQILDSNYFDNSKIKKTIAPGFYSGEYYYEEDSSNAPTTEGEDMNNPNCGGGWNILKKVFFINPGIYINQNQHFGKIFQPNFNELVKECNQISADHFILNNGNIETPFINDFGKKLSTVSPFLKANGLFYNELKRVHLLKNSNCSNNNWCTLKCDNNSNSDSDNLKITIRSGITYYNMGTLFIMFGLEEDEIQLKHNNRDQIDTLFITKDKDKLGNMVLLEKEEYEYKQTVPALFEYFFDGKMKEDMAIDRLEDSYNVPDHSRYFFKFACFPDNNISCKISSSKSEYIGLLEIDINSFLTLSSCPNIKTIGPNFNQSFQITRITEYHTRIIINIIHQIEQNFYLEKGDINIGIVLGPLCQPNCLPVEKLNLDEYLWNCLKNHFGIEFTRLVPFLLCAKKGIYQNEYYHYFLEIKGDMTNVVIDTHPKTKTIFFSTPDFVNLKQWNESDCFKITSILIGKSKINTPSSSSPVSLPDKEVLVKKQKTIGSSFVFSNLIFYKIINYSLLMVKEEFGFYSFCQNLHLVCKNWNEFVLSKIRFQDIIIGNKDILKCYSKVNDLVIQLCKKTQYGSQHYKYASFKEISTINIYKLLFSIYKPSQEFDLFNKDQFEKSLFLNNEFDSILKYNQSNQYYYLNHPQCETTNKNFNQLKEEKIKQISDLQLVIYNLLEDSRFNINPHYGYSFKIAIILENLYPSNSNFNFNHLKETDLMVYDLFSQYFNTNDNIFQLDISSYLVSNNKFEIINGDTINHGVSSTQSPSPNIENTNTIFFKNPTFKHFVPIYINPKSNNYKNISKENYKGYCGCFSTITISFKK